MADTSSNSVTPITQDKGLFAVALFIVTLICNAIGRKYGIELNATEITTLGATVASFVLGHKWKSGSIATAETNVAGAKAAAETLATSQATAASSSGAAAVEALKNLGLTPATVAVPAP